MRANEKQGALWEEEPEAPDPRNRLNELSNTQWMKETKSVWFSQPPQRDPLKAQHPATFAESDIERLILFFTRSGERVLDPFVGTGSTLVACARTGRLGTGIELVTRWADVARRRVALEESSVPQLVLEGDARRLLPEIEDASFEFIVTSPPYWSILLKDRDHKVRTERKARGLETRYSDEEADLGNLGSYEDFLKALARIFEECRRVLVPRRYMCVIVSDFRHRSRFIPYHADLIRVVEQVGFSLEGITILVQDNKNLYPYGIPYAFVSNIHHQYILVFRSASQPEVVPDDRS